MILACTCKNSYMDEKYGPGLRVHNPMKEKSSGMARFRCVVCLDVKEIPKFKREPEKEKK